MTTPTKLQLYNQALGMVGEGSLATVTDNRPERYALDRIWDEDPVKQMLEETYWDFATRSLEWNYNPAIEPDFGYTRAFDYPANFCRTVAVCTDEYFKDPLIEYTPENGKWYCDLDTIYIRYISDADDYGRDMSLWTERFRNIVATKMAAELSLRLTKSQSLQADLEAKLDKAIRKAKSLNAQEKPTQYLRPGSWTKSRNGAQGSYKGTYSNKV